MSAGLTHRHECPVFDGRIIARTDHGRVYLDHKRTYARGLLTSAIAPDDAREFGKALIALADAASSAKQGG